MKLVVTIPAYNEEGTISEVIKSIPRRIEGIDQVEVFVIDDGSTDQTRPQALSAGANQVFSSPKNIGLARTFKRGLENALIAGADIIVNTDADNQYNQSEIAKLIKPILEKKADMVIGDRQVVKLKFMRMGNKYGNLFGSWVIRKLTGSKVKDASSGFRAFSRNTALRINIHFGHTYTHETIIQAIYKKMSIIDVPIEFRERSSGKSKLISNLFTHIRNSSLIIIRTILLYKPLKTLFYVGSIIILPGIILGLRFIYFYFINQGTGKIQSLILASMLIVIGFFVIVLGLVGDLIANNRKLNEEILYQLKKKNYRSND